MSDDTLPKNNIATQIKFIDIAKMLEKIYNAKSIAQKTNILKSYVDSFQKFREQFKNNNLVQLDCYTKIICRRTVGLQICRMFGSEKPQKFEKSINTVTLLGRVGVDPQQRGNQEHPVVTFSLATSNNYKYDSGDWNQKTDWHRVVVFKPALRDAVLQYLKKGQRTLVNGRISYGEITDQDGKQRPTASIIADDVIFLQSEH